ncbi:MAG: DUF2914 domain-containing protein [Vicinamibacterales bacterium]
MASFGPALRRRREERGVSLEDIAGETRLSKRYLIALEEETIGKLPGGTYNRAYLRTYATFLGLDPEPLVRQYAELDSRLQASAEQDQLAAMNRALERRIGTTSTAQAGADARRFGARVPTLVAVTAAVLILVAGAAWLALSGFDQASRAGVDVVAGEPVTASEALSAQDAQPTEAAEPAPSEPVTSPVAEPVPPVSEGQDGAGENAEAGGQADGPADVAADTGPAARGQTSDLDAVLATHSDEGRLTVAGSGVGTAVVDRQLVGQADRFVAGSRVVFWTHVRGGRTGDTIDHVWFHDGTVVGAASLSVGSPDWRTQSRRLLEPSGVWAVEARDPEGHILARHEFQAAAN